LRTPLLESARQTGVAIKSAGRKESDDAVKAMQSKHGMAVHPVTPQIEDEWRRAAQTAYSKIRGRLVPADMFDEAVRILADYRTQIAAQRQ
jgi:hypothetical protein